MVAGKAGSSKEANQQKRGQVFFGRKLNLAPFSAFSVAPFSPFSAVSLDAMRDHHHRTGAELYRFAPQKAGEI